MLSSTPASVYEMELTITSLQKRLDVLNTDYLWMIDKKNDEIIKLITKNKELSDKVEYLNTSVLFMQILFVFFISPYFFL